MPPCLPCLPLALALIAAMAFGASPAHADRCQDIAQELKEQVDGVKIGTVSYTHLTLPTSDLV